MIYPALLEFAERTFDCEKCHYKCDKSDKSDKSGLDPARRIKMFGELRITKKEELYF